MAFAERTYTAGLGGEGTMIPAIGSGVPMGSSGQGYLVLEEAEPVRNQLRDILAKLGVAMEDVAFVGTGEEALARFAQAPPHVVFMELIGVHPEEGLEIVHEMLSRAPETRIVLVTAEARESAEVRAAVRAGAFAVIEKPLRADKVRAVMQELNAEESAIERLR